MLSEHCQLQSLVIVAESTPQPTEQTVPQIDTVTDRQNSALNSSGSGYYILSLCPNTKYLIQAPILLRSAQLATLLVILGLLSL